MTGQILSLPIADIEIGERIGFFHADHATGLAVSMAEHGQTTPIHVRRNPVTATKPWRLIAGRHRIGAADALGWVEIKAIQVADASASEETLLRLELSENLDHRSPRPLERAAFIEARARLEEAIDHPNTIGEPSLIRATRARLSSTATVAAGGGWIARTAAACGISPRTMAYYRDFYRAIIAPWPELAEALNAHQLGTSFSVMHRIASIKADFLRRKVIETIIATPEFDSLDKALVATGAYGSKGNRVAPQDRAIISFRTNWHRLPFLQKKVEAVSIAERIDLRIAREMYSVLKRRSGIDE